MPFVDARPDEWLDNAAKARSEVRATELGKDYLTHIDMQASPEIIFHDVERTRWLENYLLERIGRLDRFAQGITRCRVTLTREQGARQKGNRYSVMVEVRVPPQHDLAIRKDKEIREMRPQLPALINLAFGAIERQLKKTAALRR